MNLTTDAVGIPIKKVRRTWPPGSGEATVIASILALSLWGIAAVTVLAPPGLVDAFGNLKGTDFIQFYTTGTVVRTQRTEILYDHRALQQAQIAAVPASEPFFYLSVYPPQVAVIFAPLSRVSYAAAAAVWVAISALLYGAVTAIASQGLHLPRPLLIAALVGFPPFWHLILHGQSTTWPLAAFGFGGAALIAGRRFVAGLAFGLLAIKPQLGLALAAVLVLSREWRIIAGIAMSWALQVALSMAVVGVDPWLAYVGVIQRLPELRPYLEPKPELQHSLASFVPLPSRAQPLVWLGLSGAVIYRAWRVWSSAAATPLKIGTLVLASVLVSPHLFVYDASLVALAVLWIARGLNGEEAQDFAGWVCLLTLALLVPTRVLTGIQLSVVVMLWMLHRVTGRLQSHEVQA